MIILEYFVWHYGRALRQGFIIWKNIFWFLTHFFSLSLLLKTLFQPWKRMREYRGQGFDIGRFFETLAVNTITRLVGFAMRTAVIFIGLASLIAETVTATAALIIWLLSPFLIAPLFALIPLFYFFGKEENQKKRMDAAIADFCFSRLGASGKEEDLLAVSKWGERKYKERMEKKQWWLKENLARVPGIAKDWCFGATYVLDQFSHEFLFTQASFNLYSAEHQQQVLAIESALLKTNQANVLIVGEAGTVKRKVVRAFIDLLERGKIHPALEHKRVVELDANVLAASAKTKGEMEELLLKIFDDAVAAGNIILTIDNFGKFVKSAAGLNVSISQVLSPYFASSALQFIAMEDSDDFKRVIEPDSSLMQYFETVRIKEPCEDELVQILEDVADVAEKKHRIIVTYPAIKEIARVSTRYLTEGFLPERGIDVLENVSARVAATKAADFAGAEDVLNFIKEKIKMPIGELESGEKEKLSNLEQILRQRIIDQDEAISAISGAIRRARMEIHDTKKPIASFLFLGPTGVGKTETAKALAQVYFGSENAMIRLDMTEYQEEGGLKKLIGSFDTGEPGILASAVREKPYNIILLDEFEKSHRDVEDLFLQILDEGFFSDAFGKKIFTRNSVIIATSNAASKLIWEIVRQGANPASEKNKIIDFIQGQGIFRAELLNRFDAIIIFSPLKQKALKQIAKIMLEKLNKRLAEKNLELIINSALIEKVAKIGYDPVFGARPMKRAIQEKIEEKIAKGMISGELKPGAKIEFSAEELENL